MASASEPAAHADPAGSPPGVKRRVELKAAHWVRIGYVALVVVIWLIIMVSASYPSPSTPLFTLALLSMLGLLALLVALVFPRVRHLLGRLIIYSVIALSAVALALTLTHRPKQMKFSANASSYEQVVTTLGAPPAQVPTGPDGQPQQWAGNCPATIGKAEIEGCVLAPGGYLFYLRDSGISDYAGYAYFAGDDAPEQPLPSLLHTGGDYDNPPSFIKVRDHWYAFAYTTR